MAIVIALALCFLLCWVTFGGTVSKGVQRIHLSTVRELYAGDYL